MAVEIHTLGDELSAAYAARRTDVVPPSARDTAFDLPSAYAVEAELRRRRLASGRQTVGRKVGYANKAVWRVLKLETLVWASMYDDTVRYAQENRATLDVGRMVSPKIEPEIVIRVGREGHVGQVGLVAQPGQGADAATVLADVEWVALGFEIIDCVYADWKFQPADFVASYGLHAALVVGEPLAVSGENIPSLVEQLAKFTVQLAKNGEVIAEGSGRNALRSPALCVGELASAIARQPNTAPLNAGEIVSTGTLTESQPIAAGETWTATVDGVSLPALTLRLVNAT
jgi:2-keto-4-pentenoate hydratase